MKSSARVKGRMQFFFTKECRWLFANGRGGRNSAVDLWPGVSLVASYRVRWIEKMSEHDPKNRGGATGHSRRDFFRGSGLAAATAVLTGPATVALDEAK